MPYRNTSILSIAPYRILPPSSGGQLCIIYGHHYIGKLCQDHVAGTVDNSNADNYDFQIHPIFPDTPKRYVPFCKYPELLGLAKKYDSNAIFCEHPYMFPTAMAVSRKLKIPWFMRSHNIESERFRAFGKKWWPVMKTYEKFAMKNANGVFFITPEDRDWAIKNYEVPVQNCHLMPYGTIMDKIPHGHSEAKRELAEKLQINPHVPWLYFLGALDYLPNEQAVTYILDEVVPRLNEKDIRYQILIAGRGLNEVLKKRISDTAHITYTGFLHDVSSLLKACSVMLNPVMLGGGLKTKAVEALGYNKMVVSVRSGAAGLIPEACGNNLLISDDNDWDSFAEHTLHAISHPANIPALFYDNYYWGNIAINVLDVIKARRR